METMRQLVPGSGEGQHTETVDDSHRMESERGACHAVSFSPRYHFLL
jgi:hypothetical protein